MQPAEAQVSKDFTQAKKRQKKSSPLSESLFEFYESQTITVRDHKLEGGYQQFRYQQSKELLSQQRLRR